VNLGGKLRGRKVAVLAAPVPAGCRRDYAVYAWGWGLSIEAELVWAFWTA
jgi:hypothetical protein